jgi:hypothetical protein
VCRNDSGKSSKSTNSTTLKLFNSYISGLLSIVLSASLLLLALHTLGFTDSHPVTDHVQIEESHLLCPICHAVVEGDSIISEADAPLLLIDSAVTYYGNPLLLNLPLTDTLGRAPPAII